VVGVTTKTKQAENNNHNNNKQIRTICTLRVKGTSCTLGVKRSRRKVAVGLQCAIKLGLLATFFCDAVTVFRVKECVRVLSTIIARILNWRLSGLRKSARNPCKHRWNWGQKQKVTHWQTLIFFWDCTFYSLLVNVKTTLRRTASSGNKEVL